MDEKFEASAEHVYEIYKGGYYLGAIFVNKKDPEDSTFILPSPDVIRIYKALCLLVPSTYGDTIDDYESW